MRDEMSEFNLKALTMAIDLLIEQLLQVKNQESDIRRQLDDAREVLYNCSAVDNKPQWMIHFNQVTTLAMRLALIEEELRKLEHEHVVRHGVLSY
ncbi:unnamed protein product [Rotaria sp. Silwood1]|nr:unnamed protein product [Rotaria sp. Silwood1]CAF1660841.1 unnamed protein product [Rotaria sp. Silwood1]